jgi:hypothetical protein
MSLPQPPVNSSNGKTNPPHGISDAQFPRATPSPGVLDPEALTGIEMTVGRDPIAQQKLDDPYLVCFDEAYDAEKYD